MKFNEVLASVKGSIQTLMKKEGIDDKELEQLTTINSQVDELGKQHQELEDNHAKYRNKYIDAVINYGTKTPPKEEVQAEKTFEEIGREILAKENKK